MNAGEVVDASKELLRITDLSSVWVIAQVFERDVARLRVGSGASVTSDAFPENMFRGQITYIDPQFDNATRTGRVRIELANPGQALKIGMYVKAAFGAPRRCGTHVPGDSCVRRAKDQRSGRRLRAL